MFYSGPREAVHHALLRKQIGCDKFIVGRDHAGIDNEYEPNYASNLVKSLKKKLGISIINHNGSFWCKNCKKIVIKGECNNLLVCNKKNNFSEISGTNFREALFQKKIFKFARPELQKYLFEIKDEIFYK
jgi:sulfate adenylyltransferase